MGNHTASTRHMVDITVTVPGDDGIDPEYLAQVIAWGIDAHNQATLRSAPPIEGRDDIVIELLAVSVSPDVGMDGHGLAAVLDSSATGDSDPVYAPVSALQLREFDDNDEILWSPIVWRF